MKEITVKTKSYSPPDIDRREVLRYAGVIEGTSDIDAMLSDCISEIKDRLSYRVCWCEFEVNVTDTEIDIGFARISSSSLKKVLCDCDRAVIFCATVGVDIDRLISRYSLTSPSRAVLLQALGSERVEALCDAFCLDISERAAISGAEITRRFSPGYGDLPLEFQRDVFAVLDSYKRIGVSLGENLFMTPTKSVTAIFGIKNVK